MHRIFVDMDGVIVDFDRYCQEHALEPKAVTKRQGAYLEMQPIAGALEAIRELLAMGCDVWLATKPPTGIAFAYADKVAWVLQHLPELERRIILTHDKGLLGDAGDWLIDDRPHRANCEGFRGHLIRFHHPAQWIDIVHYFRRQAEGRRHLAALAPA